MYSVTLTVIACLMCLGLIALFISMHHTCKSGYQWYVKYIWLSGAFFTGFILFTIISSAVCVKEQKEEIVQYRTRITQLEEDRHDS